MNSLSRSIGVVIAIGFFGSIGGFISGLSQSSGILIFPTFRGEGIHLGFLGDMAVGAGAGVAGVFFLGALFGVAMGNLIRDTDWARIGGLTLVFGFMGIGLLENLSGAVDDRISSAMSANLSEIQQTIGSDLEAAAYSAKGKDLVTEAKGLFDQDKADEARIKLSQARLNFDHSLQLNSQDPDTNIEFAKLLATEARSLPTDSEERQQRFDKAIGVLSAVIKNDPGNARALYNRACYQSISAEPDLDAAVRDLEAAIAILPSVKEFAQLDQDLSLVRESGAWIPE